MRNRRCTDQVLGGIYQKDITLKMKLIPLQGRYVHGRLHVLCTFGGMYIFCLLFVYLPVWGCSGGVDRKRPNTTPVSTYCCVCVCVCVLCVGVLCVGV